MDLKNKEFIGIIKDGQSGSDLEGKYLVYIPELMASDASLKPIWARNEIHGNRFSRWLDIHTKKVMSSGAYFPLNTGMTVNVNFRSDEFESCYISNIISYVPLIDKSANRDSFYLINKTKNNSWIYQDDNREITHIMHQSGASNIIMENDRIVLHTGTPISNGIKGSLLKNAFEVGGTGTKLEFGNNSISLDATGIILKAGDTIISLSDSGIKILSQGGLDMIGEKSVNVQGKNLFLTGVEETHIYSNVTRVTGNTQLALTSNVLTMDGITSTFIKGGQVTIEGLLKTKVTGPIMEMSSLTNIFIDAPVVTINSQMLTLAGASTVIDGASIFMDGMITHGMSAATSIAKGMYSMNVSLNLGVDAANMALVTSLGMSDSISAVTNSIITGTATGVATPVGQILRPVTSSSAVGTGVSEKIAYLVSSDESYNTVVQDQFKGLHNTHTLEKNK